MKEKSRHYSAGSLYTLILTYGHIVTEADEGKVQAVRSLRSIQPTHRVLHIILGAKRSVTDPRRCRPGKCTEQDIGVSLDRFFGEPQFVPGAYMRARVVQCGCAMLSVRICELSVMLRVMRSVMLRVMLSVMLRVMLSVM